MVSELSFHSGAVRAELGRASDRGKERWGKRYFERKVTKIKGMLLQGKRKQHSGHLESLVVVDPDEMSSSLVNKTRSGVTPEVRKLES